MFRPKVPTMPQPTGLTTPPAVVEPTTITPDTSASASLPATTTPNRSVLQLTPGIVLVLVGGGTAVVLVVGAVLVSMLLAVALTATSLAVCAVVIRSVVARR
ncbi:SpdD-like protein [Streptomyces sp. DH-12]|uniref:SpdD-like protein n=1 Tax=Streptomyces sp. DH-12 TaxID=2072509 RepID=UPI000CCEE9A0|nr:SpdD-like protein [Streptomyces sp. DH-12]PNV33526.1 SpdD-like protein [Streptomyces sp. DH-12]